MTDTRRVPDPRFAPETLAVDLPSLVAARRDGETLRERAAAVERAWRADGPESTADRVVDALDLPTDRVAFVAVPPGSLDERGREAASRRVVRRLDGALAGGRARENIEPPVSSEGNESEGMPASDGEWETVGGVGSNQPGTDGPDGRPRWGVLTDGRYWRLYGGGDTDEERYHEVDLRKLVDAAIGAGSAANSSASAPLVTRFVAPFAREAFDGEAAFLDAVDEADEARRASVRDALGEQFVTAVETLADASGGEPRPAAATVFRLAFDLFVADRCGSSTFVERADGALPAVREAVAEGDVADPPTDLGPSERRALRAWVDGAARSTVGGPFGGDAPDTGAAIEPSEVDDATLARVCALLTAVSCDGETRQVDYRTVDSRHLAAAHERLVARGFGERSDERTSRRKSTGSFYTPSPVVSYLASRTAGSLVDEAYEAASTCDGGEAVETVREHLLDARIVDPAMGGGTLLVAAARRLASGVRRIAREAGAPVESAAALRRSVVSNCLYGVDVDPTATAIARLVCLAETLGPQTGATDRPPLTDRFLCGDALLGRGPSAPRTSDPTSGTADAPGSDSPDSGPGAGRSTRVIHWRTAFPGVFEGENGGRCGGGGFDAVVGNPPWKGTAGRADISARLDGGTAAHLRDAFESTSGAQPNLYAAFLERACRLAPDGYVAFVVPDALLVRLTAESARRFLLDEGGVTHLLRVGTVFPGVNEGAALVVCGPEGADAVRTWFGDADAFAAAVASGGPTYDRLRRAVVEREPQARFQLLRDDDADAVLRTLDRLDPFGTAGDVARGEEFGKRDDRVRDAPTESTRELVPGAAVEPYAVRPSEVRHVRESAVTKDAYDPPKLLCRQTGRFLVATLSGTDAANLKSVYDAHVERGGRRRLCHLLGLLNSTVYNYYHYVARNAYPAQFPQTNQRNYETLPVWSGTVDGELVSLVEARLAVGRERAGLAGGVDAVVAFDEASVALGAFDPETVDETLSLSHRGETPGLRIADLSVATAGTTTLRATYETDEGSAERDVFAFGRPDERVRTVLEAWVPAVGDAALVDRRACGLRAVGRSDRTTPERRLRALRVPDPERHADRLAAYVRERRRADELARRAAKLDRRIDARVADLVGLTDEQLRRVRETMAAVPGWRSLRPRSSLSSGDSVGRDV